MVIWVANGDVMVLMMMPKKSVDKTKKKKITLTGRWNGWNGVDDLGGGGVDDDAKEKCGQD